MKFYDLCMKKRIRRTVALVMTIAFVISLISVFSTASLLVSNDFAETKPYILLDNERIENVVLEDDAKLRLYAVSPAFVGNYSWQIAHPENENVWVNIDLARSDKLWLTSALISSMTTVSGEAKLRCRISNGEEELYTDPLKVTVSYSADSHKTESSISGTPQRVKLTTKSGARERSTYSLVINYLFDDNTIAFEPFGATLAEGSDFTTPVKSPSIVGYKAVRRIGDAYVSAETVYPEIYNIQQNVVINVIYEPDLVNFSVHHHKQDVYDDLYSDTPDFITTGQALTGTIVGDGLAFTEEQWPGFKSLAYEHLEVAADGSTTIEIRYDRKFYLVEFDMNGGYGTEPVYTRYEATVGTNTPSRHGYIFDGWELVSYGGSVPTDEQKSKYDINNGKTISVPAANLKYKARWVVGETKYTMVFWYENADDNGYSYWGHLGDIPAMSGDKVSARDIIGQVPNIDDEAYFEFNSEKSDKDIIVEGDGSTVVNVYYTRKFYTITFKAPGKCSIEENHTHSDDCYEEICGRGHVHTSDCVSTLSCTIPEHIVHTDDCLVCGKSIHVHGGADCDCNIQEHKHSLDCWSSVGSKTTKPRNAPSNPSNGYVYYRSSRLYIYLYEEWYVYNGFGYTGLIVQPSCGIIEHSHGTDCACAEEAHIHSDACYKDVLHKHNQDCYTYSCGEVEHTHSDKCFRLVCNQPEGHTHSNDCNNASRTNTVKIVKEKYGKFIGRIWPIEDDNGIVYDSGERWKPSSSSFFSYVLVYIAQMPPDDFTLTLDTANDRPTYTMEYYLQVLDGEPYDVTVGGINYKLDNTIVAKYNYVTKEEDFFDIKGFAQASSSPAFPSNGQLDTNGGTIKFYYKRNQYSLKFKNNGLDMDDKTVEGIQYGANIKKYYFVPEYPNNLEPGAYQFAGWYTSPGCFDGSEVDWDHIAMEDGDMMLYAKWSPSVHNLRVFLDSTLTDQIGETQIVDHGSFATEPFDSVSNEGLLFQGWFYMDDGKEKAFVFHGIPIIDDIDVYAKWGSHVSVDYKVYYKLKDTDIDVAAPEVSFSIVGNNKTFEAKAGNDLYEAYRDGYFPHVSSHTVTMSATGDREFTFWYTYIEAMPYKVLYVDENGVNVHAPKIVMNNRLSVVTETFLKSDNRMPDAYQKRLILSSTGVDADGDGILDNNVLVFHYSTDTEHAYYRVVHYVENLAGGTYREFRSEEMVGKIGESYTVKAIELTGFKYVPELTKVTGSQAVLGDGSVSAVLSSDGLLIELYYERSTVKYSVQYVDSQNNPVAEEKLGDGDFGEQILEYALDLSDKGYILVSDNLKMLTLSASEDRNVITFVYDEQNVAIKYQIVGPENCGTLVPQTENIKAISGVVNGSLPTANKGFVFVGWFLDAECTQAVDKTIVNADNRIMPKQEGGVWKNKTYFAKFEALQTNLTISTTSVAAVDASQSFIFTVKGKAGTDTESINITVAVTGNGSVTITDLPVGDYTVTNHTDWSWRFGNNTPETQIKLEYHGGSNQLTYVMSRTNDKWLDDNNGINNSFKD